MDIEPEDLRKAKQALTEAVREADTAVQASIPSLDELEKIEKAFGESLGRVAKMLKPELACAYPAPRNPSDN